MRRASTSSAQPFWDSRELVNRVTHWRQDRWHTSQIVPKESSYPVMRACGSAWYPNLSRRWGKSIAIARSNMTLELKATASTPFVDAPHGHHHLPCHRSCHSLRHMPTEINWRHTWWNTTRAALSTRATTRCYQWWQAHSWGWWSTRMLTRWHSIRQYQYHFTGKTKWRAALISCPLHRPPSEAGLFEVGPLTRAWLQQTELNKWDDDIR